MMWILWAGIAIMIAVILYSTIENQIPPEWKNMVGAPEQSQPAFTPNPPDTKDRTAKQQNRFARDSKSWLYRSGNGIQELSRDALEPLVDGTITIEPPVLYLACANGELYTWISVGVPLEDNKSIAVLVDGQAQKWQVDSEFKVVAPEPLQIVEALKAKTQISFQLKLKNAEKYSKLTYTTNATKEGLRRFSNSCLR